MAIFRGFRAVDHGLHRAALPIRGAYGALRCSGIRTYLLVSGLGTFAASPGPFVDTHSLAQGGDSESRVGAPPLPVDGGVTPPQSASLHLLAKPLDLALQPLDGGRERCGGRRTGGRGPELAVRADEHGCSVSARRPAADPGDQGRALVRAGADPIPSALPRHARVADVDVVRAGGQVLAGAGAEGDVARAGGIDQRVPSGGGVAVAGGVSWPARPCRWRRC